VNRLAKNSTKFGFNALKLHTIIRNTRSRKSRFDQCYRLNVAGSSYLLYSYMNVCPLQGCKSFLIAEVSSFYKYL